MQNKGKALLTIIFIAALILPVMTQAKEFKSELEEIQFAQNLFSKAENSFGDAEKLYTEGNKLMDNNDASVKDINTATESFLRAADMFGDAEKFYNEANIILAKYVDEPTPEPEPAPLPVPQPEPVPEPEPVVYNPPPVYEPVEYNEPEEIRVMVADIKFDLDESRLKSNPNNLLDQVIKKFNEANSATLYVEGHTCNIATDEYNQTLSEERASAVAKYLIQNGVPQSSIVQIGYGESSPTATNTNENGREQNRRVEIYLVTYE